MNRIKKASQISEANIIPLFIDEELVQCEIKSNKKYYSINRWGGIYICDCADFEYRSFIKHYLKQKRKNSDFNDEQFKCKHILAIENYLIEKGFV